MVTHTRPSIEAICLTDGQCNLTHELSFSFSTVRNFCRMFEGPDFLEEYAKQAYDFLVNKQAAFPKRQIALPADSHPRLILERACNEGFFPFEHGVEYSRLKETLEIVEQSFLYSHMLAASGMGEHDFASKYYNRASQFLIRKIQAFPGKKVPFTNIFIENEQDIIDAVKLAVSEGFYPIEMHQKDCEERRKPLTYTIRKTGNVMPRVDIRVQARRAGITLDEYISTYSGLARQFLTNTVLRDLDNALVSAADLTELAILKGFIPVAIAAHLYN